MYGVGRTREFVKLWCGQDQGVVVWASGLRCIIIHYRDVGCGYVLLPYLLPKELLLHPLLFICPLQLQLPALTKEGPLSILLLPELCAGLAPHRPLRRRVQFLEHTPDVVAEVGGVAPAERYVSDAAEDTIVYEVLEVRVCRGSEQERGDGKER